MNLSKKKSCLLFASLLLALSGNAFINYQVHGDLVKEDLPSAMNFGQKSLRRSSTPAGDPTRVINLPLIERNSPAATPIPASLEEILLNDGTSVTETPTATATFFPQQTGATNLPITLGALIILGVIVLAWLIFGRQSKG